MRDDDTPPCQRVTQDLFHITVLDDGFCFDSIIAPANKITTILIKKIKFFHLCNKTKYIYSNNYSSASDINNCNNKPFTFFLEHWNAFKSNIYVF